MPRLTECGTGFCNPSLPFSQLEVGLMNRCVGISAEKGKRTWTNTKGKHTSVKGVLREDGLRTLLYHSSYPQSISPSMLPTHVFHFDTRHKVSEGCTRREVFLSFCVSTLFIKQNEELPDFYYLKNFSSLILMCDTHPSH